MEQTYKMCQSCGMPFKNDPQGGGSNADGSKSTTYCSYCYVSGEFTRPKMTVTEMQQLVKTKLKGMGLFHRLFAGFFASS
ncbi:MAG: zinc ribbon domain-containing protein, partial [Bacteroidia bacterium]